MNIKYHNQPSGNTCGPTCLYMVMEYILNKQNDLPFDVEIKYNIKDISDMCGTDWIVGTPPDRMEKGMKTLDINYVEYQNSPRPYELLDEILNDGNVPILRTITRGAPHWIIVTGRNFVNEDKYNVLDPWLGKITYTEKELDSVWKPRNHQFFEVKIPKELIYNPDYQPEDYYLTLIRNENTTGDTKG